MFFQTSDRLSIFYDDVGPRDAPAVLLVHGSTLTGQQDYAVQSHTIERFAKDFRVITPDCRGHGQSAAKWLTDGDSRTLTYSFADMAQDLADLIASLGIAPAFVFGHSNGGNVALYMARFHPAQTRGAILLAANAYIDDHLRARVPVGMNPDRVARERPEWMREMMALHDVHHGDGYWRALLDATVRETITNPDWRKDDLADVRVPCLVVQGENDVVNVPGRHAQVLHDWLPNSQLWIPEGIGHSVHWEIPDEFERRAREFFASVGAG